MTTSISATELPTFIQTLLEQKVHHTDAIAKIDATLAKVSAALNGTVAAPAAPAAVKVKPVAAKKRGRSVYAVSASELVLGFLKTNKEATTKAITQHLASKGRSAGAASNALSVLTTQKKLKRTPLGKGVMGSKYSLA